MEIPSEPVKEFYRLRRCFIDLTRKAKHEELAKLFGGELFSFEQAFWIDFVSMALCTWDRDAEGEIRLSEIFRVYLTIYREEIERNMTLEDELSFFNLLKEKYRAANSILRHIHDSSVACPLGQLAVGEDIDALRLGLAEMHILSGMCTCSPMPIRLVEDV